LRSLPPPRAALFPYTTLFRSGCVGERETIMADESFSPRQRVAAILGALLGAAFGAGSILTTSAASVRQVPDGFVAGALGAIFGRSEEHTSELQSRENLVCRLL